MNDDMISRQAAIEVLNKLARDNFTINDAFAFYLGALHDTADEIKALPSAQPEIIRCKDCKWFGNIGCAIEIADDSDRPSENDFCSFAERRTDG